MTLDEITTGLILCFETDRANREAAARQKREAEARKRRRGG